MAKQFSNGQKRNKFKLILLGLWLSFSILSCQKATDKTKDKELVFVVNLVNDDKKVQEYLDYHKKIWPEVEAGFKKAGYKKNYALPFQ